jgi:hypothetical protein
MFAGQLKKLLSKDGIELDNVPRLAALCKDWFMAEPSVTTCTLHFLFQELAGAWDDAQGIPAAEHESSSSGCCPAL